MYSKHLGNRASVNISACGSRGYSSKKQEMICLSDAHLVTHPSTYPSITHLSIQHPPLHSPHLHLPFYPFIPLATHLPIHALFFLSIHLFTCLHLFTEPLSHLSIHFYLSREQCERPIESQLLTLQVAEISVL